MKDKLDEELITLRRHSFFINRASKKGKPKEKLKIKITSSCCTQLICCADLTNSINIYTNIELTQTN